jgi:hypothetical protein
MQWSAVTWHSANPARQEPEHRWYRGGGAVQPVFSRTLPQALPEASSGVSPSQEAHLLQYKCLRSPTPLYEIEK